MSLAFSHCPLGGLQWIDFDCGGRDFWFDMGGEITNPQFPFSTRRGVRLAELLSFHLNDSITTDAFVDDRIEDAGRVNLMVCYGHIMVSLKL